MGKICGNTSGLILPGKGAEDEKGNLAMDLVNRVSEELSLLSSRTSTAQAQSIISRELATEPDRTSCIAFTKLCNCPRLQEGQSLKRFSCLWKKGHWRVITGRSCFG